MKTAAIALGVCLFLALAFQLSQRFGPKPTASSAPVEEKVLVSEDEKRGQVWARACDVIRDRLKAPGSAKFPARYAEGVEIVIDDRSTVTGYVDAKNQLGGEERLKWKVVLKEIDGGQRYQVEDVKLDS